MAKEKDITKIERISVDLLKLKPIDDLKEVYTFYKKYLDSFFDRDGNPKKEYFEDVICPICGSSQYEHKVTIDYFKYLECSQCHSVYNGPRLKEGTLAEMYKDGAYQTYFNKLTVQSQPLRKNLIDVRKYKQVASFFDNPGRILDVGCGTGSFLKVCQEHSWEVYGLDPSNYASQIAKQSYGLKISQEYFEDFMTDKKFDCIAFWGALEHISDPMKIIAKATEMLNKNGVIVFEVPSAESFLMNYVCRNDFVPYRYIESARHLLFFSRSSINFLCKKYNLKIAYLETNGLDIQTILLSDFEDDIKKDVMAIQRTIDELLLGDHFRVFLKKI